MIYIRGDGNARIGAGHLMRCMTIAEELARLQGSREGICFICADEASGAIAEEKGFRSHVLGTDYRDMESELPLWRDLRAKLRREEAFPGEERPLVLVDSYHVTDLYLAALREWACTVLMDDMGARPYPVDCVINYNAPASLEAYRKLYQGSGTRLLIGSRYTPLRRQFRREGEIPEAGAGETEKTERDTVREVLITTGGGDMGNIAEEILKRIYGSGFVFHLVTGRFHPGFQRMGQLEKTHDRICVHYDVKDMAGLMRRCQIALTAGGSTVYELAALGVPFICFSCAENQEALVDYIGSRQIAGSAGAWHREPEGTLARIEKLFGELAGDPMLRETYRGRERAMADGKGAERLAEEILGLRGTEKQRLPQPGNSRGKRN